MDKKPSNYLLTSDVIEITEDGQRDVDVDVFEALDAFDIVIGRLRLLKDGVVYGIWVDPQWRRNRVATELWEIAATFGFEPKHSAERTDEGDAWAQTIPGFLPERVRV